jgi:hypothetical protein
MLRMLLIAGLVCVAAGAARAAEGVIAATGLEAVPAGATIAVRPWDNSDQNLAIQRDVENGLRARGFTVVEDAPFVLSFETRDTVGTWDTGDRRTIVEFERRSGGDQEDESKVRLNLYASDRGGVLNKGRTAPDVKPSRFQLEMTLDGQNGVRVWQGTMTADLERSDRASLIQKMVPALIAKIGETVKGETVPLP